MIGAALVAVAACSSAHSSPAAGPAPTGAAPATTTVPVPPAASPSSAPTRPDPGSGSGRLRLTQQSDCCGPVGALSTLTVRDQAGSAVLVRRYGSLAEVLPVIDVTVPAGRYTVEVAQQPCVAGCGDLPAPAPQCTTVADVGASATVFLLATFSPGTGCYFVASPTAPAAPISDAIALAGADVDCGLDAALADAARSGDNVGLSQARRCLVDAANRGTTAYLQALEPSGVVDRVAAVVYRVRADGSVDVFRVVDPDADVPAWQQSRCQTMVADPVRTFLLQGCAAPTAVPWS